MKVNLTRVGVIIGILGGLATLLSGFSAWPGIPARVDTLERRQTAVEKQVEENQRVLIRVDENVKFLREQTKK